MILTLNTLRPRQNDCLFEVDHVWISVKISLKFVLKGPINNIPALVQIMAWHRPGHKPLSESMLVGSLMPISSHGLNELKVLQDFVRFQQTWCHLVKKVMQVHQWPEKRDEENVQNFVVSTMPADGLALSCARVSGFTDQMQVSHIWGTGTFKG